MKLYVTALFYERNHQIQEAQKLYHQCIAVGENVSKAKIALVRLQEWEKFSGVNLAKKEEFENARENEIQALERWLLK